MKVNQTSEKDKKCSICKEMHSDYGNNAQPINDGVCCDYCNTTMVIPARIRRLIRERS